MKSKQRFLKFASRLMFLMLGGMLLFSSCENIFSGDDLKTIISNEVETATAPEVTLTVQRDPLVAGGTISGDKTRTVKVGVAFSISVDVSNLYGFTGWTDVGETGAVSFADAASATTTATVTKEATGIIIQANFDKRPTVVKSDPSDGEKDVLKNKKITLRFSEAMDPSTISFENISITTAPSNSGQTPVSITERFNDPEAATGDLQFTISLKTGQYFDENYEVFLGVASDVCDASGLAMASDSAFSSSFVVGTSSDVEGPYWDATNPLAITAEDGSTLSANGAGTLCTNNSAVILKPKAYDQDDSVQYLNITETDGSASATTQVLYQSSISYSFKTSGDGEKTLTITAEDPSGNESAEQTIGVVFDTASPVLASVSIADTDGSSEYTNGPISIVLGAIDETVSGVALREYRVGSGEWTGFSGSGATTTISGTENASVSVDVRLTDYAGNVSLVSTSNGLILDTLAPVVSGLSIASSNGANTAYAKTGDVITLNLTLTESNPNTSSVSIASHAATVSQISGASYKATYTVAGSESQSAASYSLVFTDKAGNTSGTITTGASGSVTIDYTAPTLSIASIASSNTNPLYAKAADAVTVTFTATDANLGTADNITATIAGSAQTASATSGSVKTVSRTIASSGETQGTATYQIVAKDLAGNTTSGTSAASGSVIIDTVAPVVSGLSISSSNSNALYAKTSDVITLNFTLTELNPNTSSGTIAGHAAAMGSGSATYTVAGTESQSAVSYSLVFTDKAGNTSGTIASGASGSVTIDYTAPTLSIATIASSNTNPLYAKADDAVTVTFTATDANLGTADNITATIAGSAQIASATSGSAKTVSRTIASSGETQGTATYQIVAKDLAGNTASGTSAASGSVIIDTIAPVVSGLSLASNNTTNTAYAKTSDVITLSFTLTEANLKTSSGTIAGNTAAVSQVSGTSYKSTYTVAGSESQSAVTYGLSFTDEAGNASGTIASGASGSVTIDYTAPTLSIASIASSNTNPLYAKADDAVTVTFTATDANLGTADNITATIAGSVQIASATSGSAKTVSRTIASSGETQGTATYQIVAKDLAGNTASGTSAASGSVIIDTIAPSNLTVSSPTANAYVNGSAIVSFSGAESKAQAYIGSGAWQDISSGAAMSTVNGWSGTAEGAATLYLRNVDVAGNTTATTIAVTKDVTAPTATGTPSKTSGSTSYVNASEEGGANVTFRVSLGTSGAAVGDTLELLAGGSALSTPQTAVLTSTDVTTNEYHDFTFAGNLLGTGTSVTSVDVSAKVTDKAGNEGAGSVALTLTRDVTAPSNLTVSSPTANAYVNGSAIVSFSGAESKAQAYIGSGAWQDISSGAAMSTVNGWSGTAEGAATLYLRNVDVAGNTTATTIAVTKDVTAPTATGTPSKTSGSTSYVNASEEGGANVTFRVSLGTSGAAVGDTLELLAGGSALSTPQTAVLTSTDVTTNGYHDFTFAGNLLGTGTSVTSVDVSAKVTDKAGNEGAGSVALTLTRDVTAPTATGTPSKTSGSTSYVNASEEGGANVTFRVSLGTSGAAVGDTLELLAGGSALSTPQTAVLTITDVTTNEYHDFTFAGNLLGTGTSVTSVDVSAKVTDKAGNEGAGSVALTLTRDVTAPSNLTVSSPTANAYVNGSAIVSFSGAESKAQAYIGSGAWQDISSGAAMSTVNGWSGTAEGAATLYLRNVDVAGNTTATTIAVTKDVTAPTATGTPSKTSGSTSYVNASEEGGANVTFRVSLGTSGAAVGDTLELLAGGSALSTPQTAVLTSTDVTTNGYHDFTFAGNLLGTGTSVTSVDVSAKVTDKAGNEGAGSVALTLTRDVTAPTATGTPSKTSGSTSYVNASEEGGANVTFRVSLGTSGAAVGDTLELLAGGSALSTPQTAVLTITDVTTNEYHDFTFAGNLLGTGTSVTSVDVSAKVTDKAGNEGAGSVALTLTRDVTAPSNLTVSSPTANAYVNGSAIVSFSGAESKAQAYIGSGAWQDISSGAAMSTVNGWSGTAEGAATLYLRNVDVAGNTTATTIAVTKDVTAPTATGTPSKTSGSTSYVNASEEGGANVTFRVSLGTSGAAVGDTLELLAGGSALSTPQTAVLTSTDVTTNGYHDFTFAGNLLGTGTSVTSVDVSAKVTDKAGNEGAGSVALTLTRDVTAPSIFITGNVPTAAVNSGTPTITIKTNTADISGVKNINYWIGTVAKASATAVYQETIDPPETGDNQTISKELSSISTTDGTFRFSLVDAAGNETSVSYQMNWTTEYLYGTTYTLSLRSRPTSTSAASSAVTSYVSSSRSASSLARARAAVAEYASSSEATASRAALTAAALPVRFSASSVLKSERAAPKTATRVSAAETARKAPAAVAEAKDIRAEEKPAAKTVERASVAEEYADTAALTDEPISAEPSAAAYSLEYALALSVARSAAYPASAAAEPSVAAPRPASETPLRAPTPPAPARPSDNGGTIPAVLPSSVLTSAATKKKAESAGSDEEA